MGGPARDVTAFEERMRTSDHNPEDYECKLKVTKGPCAREPPAPLSTPPDAHIASPHHDTHTHTSHIRLCTRYT